MKARDLKAFIAGLADDDAIFLKVPTGDYWGTVEAHAALLLVETLIYHNGYVDVVVPDTGAIEFPDASEVAEMVAQGIEVSQHGYYAGKPVRKVYTMNW